jgi:hypothetical protein
MSDFFFNMQREYQMPGDFYLPYAFDPIVHHRMDIDKVNDGCMLGMPYRQRNELVNLLRSRGWNIVYENGPIMDEYRTISNQSFIGLNYASERDLNARAFELAAMGLVPLNSYVPDLGLYFEDGKSTLTFRNVQDAAAKFEWAMSNRDEAMEIANRAHKAAWERDAKYGFPVHSYDMRCQAILDTVLG